MGDASESGWSWRLLRAGRFALDGGAMFGIIPKPLWVKLVEPDERNRIPLAMRCLLIEAGDRLVLVDNGVGDKIDERFRDLYAVDQEKTDLARALKGAGFGFGDVTLRLPGSGAYAFEVATSHGRDQIKHLF